MLIKVSDMPNEMSNDAYNVRPNDALNSAYNDTTNGRHWEASHSFFASSGHL